MKLTLLTLNKKKTDKPKHYISMSQIHSEKVTHVTKEQLGKKIPNTDGLITQDLNTPLATVTADCLPLIFFDSKNQVLGVAHAGYKGILKGIVEEMILKMKENGARLDSLYLEIGPSIHSCCYDVSQSRVEEFKHKFPTLNGEVKIKHKKYFLSLQEVVKNEAISCGINKNNIKITNICTRCHPDFFSYRGDGKNTRMNTTFAFFTE